MKVEHTIVRRETRPDRFEQINETTDADAVDGDAGQHGVLFTGRREVLATIMALPVAGDVDAT